MSPASNKLALQFDAHAPTDAVGVWRRAGGKRTTAQILAFDDPYVRILLHQEVASPAFFFDASIFLATIFLSTRGRGVSEKASVEHTRYGRAPGGTTRSSHDDPSPPIARQLRANSAPEMRGEKILVAARVLCMSARLFARSSLPSENLATSVATAVSATPAPTLCRR
eukprot:CAMPEP_0113302570 /NCGR_PEP_ID=MMETSP0010_2-20120614/3341_1 /TAXON_ID=216773 ORGANISM="Corethron hystrix, Strain 308" /NCGR_SAMPLE_ID=MMETSP0010_2 /ASSEMBLY_ACC=CAM_ASM_000155 /LENGTH=167 /DNA_ID=CAMNT_0000156409 /DNA_START=38 /DNA_END=542 /DNA_ORIENTATION=+ /assembly_acc=CAM_ASM_000155